MARVASNRFYSGEFLCWHKWEKWTISHDLEPYLLRHRRCLKCQRLNCQQVMKDRPSNNLNNDADSKQNLTNENNDL